MSISAQFEEFRLASIEADEKYFGDCRALEPSLFGMLQLVLAHPEHKEFFVQQFISMATGEASSPAELVPYCMRELKFPAVLYAVRHHLQALQAQNRHALYMNYCSHVVKSYDDFIWEDAEMWDYYRAKELVPSVVPELIKRLSMSDPEVQFNALYAIESMGPCAIDAMPAIQALIEREPNSTNLLGRARLAVAAIQASI